MLGLWSTLFQYKAMQHKLSEGTQIIHSHGCHWVVAHKEVSFSDVVKVYDSLYDEVDDVVKNSKLLLTCSYFLTALL